MSNNLDPYKADNMVGPDWGPDCFQMLSADNTSKHRVEEDVVTLSSELVCVPYAVLFARRCVSNAIFACISKPQTKFAIIIVRYILTQHGEFTRINY